jgi:restriction system protein
MGPGVDATAAIVARLARAGERRPECRVLYTVGLPSELEVPRPSMKWQMNENSLFAILLRSPWWMSFAVAGVLAVAGVMLLPEQYRVFALVSGGPFIVIGCMAAWKQWRAPSGKRIERTLESVRAMTWIDFAHALETAYRADGYEVSQVHAQAADFTIRKEWRTSLVSCKRWKAARTGVEQLRELQAAKEAHSAHECIYIAVGDVSDNARAFAVKHAIRLVGAAELAQLLPAPRRDAKGA